MGSVYDAWLRRDDPMVAWVVEMIYIMEQITGRKPLDEALDRYREERKEESNKPEENTDVASNTI